MLSRRLDSMLRCKRCGMMWEEIGQPLTGSRRTTAAIVALGCTRICIGRKATWKMPPTGT